MARRKKRTSAARILLALAVLFMAGGAAWLAYPYLKKASSSPSKPADATAGAIDPANEGQRVKISGQLIAAASAHDREFGIGAKSAMLFRKVEMLQWQEHCAGAECSYEKVWSASAIDSHKFHTAAGHENPPLRIVSARFDAANMHLGVYEVDPALIEAQLPALERPVHAGELPPNLAATFSVREGLLYAGGDPASPDVGTVRVSFREVPFGAVTLTGAQRGKHLTH
jgi:hypothetical protein